MDTDRNCIRRRRDGVIIALATEPGQAIGLEGNLYFHPDCVRRDLLETSDRLYHCSYKGICNWVDMRIGDLYVPDVAWIYADLEPAYQHIGGWYGFYPEHRAYTTDHCDAA